MTKTFEDRKFQDGDSVIWNTNLPNATNTINETYDTPAVITKLYDTAGKSRGDYAYLVHYGPTLGVSAYVWGYQLRPAMFKYDPKQAGDTDDDV